MVYFLSNRTKRQLRGSFSPHFSSPWVRCWDNVCWRKNKSICDNPTKTGILVDCGLLSHGKLSGKLSQTFTITCVSMKTSYSPPCHPEFLKKIKNKKMAMWWSWHRKGANHMWLTTYDFTFFYTRCITVPRNVCLKFTSAFNIKHFFIGRLAGD